ncbi:MAG: hypothetical protein VR68_09265 [Peptococcaceae bacterium BRH_c4a]|nr:MAG: hypothetical protein VR68_09265 [Peptococcaceae bacterium BRH_c4a]
MLIKTLRKVLPAQMYVLLKMFYEWLMIRSLNSAIRFQKLHCLYKTLENIVPDIKHQYTNYELRSYRLVQTRALHAFQISLVSRALEQLYRETGSPKVVVDIGDSSGTHLQYLQKLFDNIIVISINMDIVAVEKIRSKGIEAICARAEDLDYEQINADVFLSFEMLEHLTDPISFLKKLSDQSSCRYFIVTVPYLKNSRVGLHHIRNSNKTKVNAENTHIFELSPSDWRLIFKHSGWTVVSENIYLQYPKFSPIKYLWRNFDFDGFYGAILKRDSNWSDCYVCW